MRNCLIIMLALTMLPGWQSANAGHRHDARVEVWTAPYQDDPYEDEAYLEVFMRLSRRGYVTVYQITPYGNAEILYPRPHHWQRELRADRVYRLSDLADDVYLYDEEEGEVQIGVIYTPEPVALAPWLESSFVEAGLVLGRNKFIYAHFDFPRIFARVEADIRIRLGSRCAPAFFVTPVHIRPHFVHRHPRWYRGHHKPHPHYEKRDHGKRGYEPSHARVEYRNRPAEPKKRSYEKRATEVRRVTVSSRPPAREQAPVVQKPSPRSRRDHRSEAPKETQARDKDKQKSKSRRDQQSRTDN